MLINHMLLTRRWNMCAVITDGTAVLGLGDIGPEAGMPVMEGKCLYSNNLLMLMHSLFVLKTKDVDEIVGTIYLNLLQVLVELTLKI